MAFAIYGKTNQERVWLVDETTFDTLAQPTVTDEVKVLPGG
jgi:hypothetical protein